MRRIVLAFACVSLVALLAPTASAHEGRSVGGHTLTVGWGTEPAYAGFTNSVQVRIAHNDGTPSTVVKAGDLKVDVTTGDDKLTLSLAPHFVVGRFGDPGDYRAFLVPTRPGVYTFRIYGKIEGQTVDQKFTSSEKTFDSLRDPSEAMFPDKNPTSGDLAARLDREIPRLKTELAADVKAADDSASSAKTFGMIGLGLGAVALVLSIVALSRKKA